MNAVTRIIVVCGLAIVGATASFAFNNESSQTPVYSFRVADLGTKVEILGNLGVPVRDVVAIKGTWGWRPANPDGTISKPEIENLIVTEVDGIELDEPVYFKSRRVVCLQETKRTPDRTRGTTWEARACERLVMSNLPREIQDAVVPPNKIRYATPPPSPDFDTELLCYQIKDVVDPRYRKPAERP